MKTVKIIFKDGVFVPLEDVEIPDGTEGITVYLDNQNREIEKPSWWNQLRIEEKKKEALLEFSRKVAARVAFNDIKVVTGLEGLEVFVLVTDEFESLKPVMEVALSVYERKGVYLPVQVISERRLSRWREQGNKIYKSIEEGVSIK
jgi:predicted DNA-binding antitoxin AbrB/MazE fold protein